MDTARERIIFFIESQGIRPKDFLSLTSLKKGFIDKSHSKSGASDLYLSKILESYPNLSAEWLVTGKGSMLLDETPKGGSTNSSITQIGGTNNRAIGGNKVEYTDKESAPVTVKLLEKELEHLRILLREKEEIIKSKEEIIKSKEEIIYLLSAKK